MAYKLNNAIYAANRFYPTLAVMHEIDTKDLKFNSKLILDNDGDTSYTSTANHDVHLGVNGLMKMWDGYIKSDAELYSALDFVRTHELCHLLYTGGKSYNWAIISCIQNFCTYIADKEGDTVRFRKQADLENYIYNLNNRYHINVTSFLSNVSAFIANSLEDGRIERIYSVKNKGFAKSRLYYRGTCTWNNGACQKLDISNPLARISIVENQILSLATCQIYQKGFVMEYGNTEVGTLVNNIIPYITEGYLARNTKAMGIAAGKIATELAPLIYECIQSKPQDNEINHIIAKMLKELLTALANSDSFGNSDINAMEDDTGDMNTMCSKSDLVITLSDDVYDKLKEKSKKTGSDEDSGITILREHTKEENTESEDGENISESTDSNAKNEPHNNASESTSEADSTSDGQSVGSSKKASETAENEAKSRYSDSDKADISEQHESGSNKKSSGKNDVPDEEVLKEMEDAAQQVKAEADEAINTINQASIAKNTSKIKCPENHSIEPVSSNLMKDICDFKELRRKYKVNDCLPPELLAKGNVLHKKIDKYFKSIYTPDIRNRRSGALDKQAITKLAKNKTNIFMKKGSPKMCNACVYILIDNSGSMCGAKRRAACQAAAVIEEGFKGLMPMKIVAFDSTRTVIHEVVKDWNESFHENCCWNFCLHGRSGNGNEDNYDIQIATRELLSRPVDKRMLIVLSDGAPADEKATHDAIVEARKKGIHVSGIYFEEGRIGYDAETFKSMYERDYVCCTTREISSELERILEKFAHKK